MADIEVNKQTKGEMMFNRINLLALLLALIATPALAQDYVIKVNGIVCEFCSLGVTKKVSKLPFIDRDRYNKGVKVEIEDQMVTIAVKDAAELDKEALFAAIESGGYNPVDIWLLTPEGERVDYQP
ncbi:MAG: heavy-metal-associated domain-containing protein [Gammaproteobacteria bacterium]